MPFNKKVLDKITSKTKIYLLIIAILLILICVYERKFIVPAIILYIALIAYAFFTNSKKKNEFFKHIQELTLDVDSAAKNTLINSPFPLVIIQADGSIVWKNNRFVNEFVNIDMSGYIQEIAKEIKQEIVAQEDKKTIEKQISIEDKTYKIYSEYAKSKQKEENKYIITLYFIENTQNTKLEKMYNDSRICVGIAMIDNYEEIMQRISSEEKPRITASIEKTVYNWIGQTGGLAVKRDRDTFVFTFEKKYLEKMENNKFDILDKIKEISIEGKLQSTLSIAISEEGDTIYDKYVSALSAIDIALGRGGDQAVIRRDGNYQFFGGRTQEVEKRTKVKSRIIAHALEELMIESKNVLIMGHTSGDIDCMGSSLGLYRMAKDLGKDVNIVSATADSTLADFIETLKEVEEYKEALIGKNEAIEKTDEDTLLIVVDTHRKNYVEVPELLQMTKKIVVIDHHRRSTEFIDSPTLVFHEVYASSTAELVIEILQYAKKEVNLTDLEVESLYGGIMVDTKNFTFKTGVRTFEAAAYLRKLGVDIIKVKKIFQMDLDSYNIISDIVKNVEMVNGNIAIGVYEKEDENARLICAKTADELITISDITASFVIGSADNRIFVSGRSTGTINVQVILEKLRRRRAYNCCRSTIR